MMMPAQSSITLRNRPLVNFCWIGAVGSFAMFSGTAVAAADEGLALFDQVGIVGFGLVPAAVFVRGTRMRMELDSEITIVNWATTKTVPWGDVAQVSVDYSGLHLHRSDGTVASAASLGKSNWATWLNRRVAADERVDVVRRELKKHRRQMGA